ncbi:hypothetical protein [Paenibacillus puerhi]|uniref:hypothetical protein n=1 Tax=Paenibacillus puerhi TaxID=2692622 RepID=UPI001359EB58|nr:hypothetical protein [Paenibacillus puerhi]
MAGGKGWLKLGSVALGMAFCLFFGVSLATQGTERIHGPLTAGGTGAPAGPARAYSAEPAGAKKVSGTEAKTAGVKSSAKEKEAPGATGKPVPRRPEEPAAETGINRVGNKAGELLQILSYHAIRGVVSLFETLLK